MEAFACIKKNAKHFCSLTILLQLLFEKTSQRTVIYRLKKKKKRSIRLVVGRP